MMGVRVAILIAVLAAAVLPARASDLFVDGGHGAVACPPADPYSVVVPVPVDLLIGPGVGYQPLAQVPPCQRLAIVTCEYRTGWCKLRYGRYDGWLFDPERRHIHFYPLGH
jgi:hypothetical protein